MTEGRVTITQIAKAAIVYVEVCETFNDVTEGVEAGRLSGADEDAAYQAVFDCQDYLSELVNAWKSGKSVRTDQSVAAVLLGRAGGRKGGLARAKALTPERRREIARKAAIARWHPEGSGSI